MADLLGGLLLHVAEHVLIGVGGDLDRRVAEALGDDLERHASEEQERGVRVPQAVEGDGLECRGFGGSIPDPGQRLWVDRLAIFERDDEFRFSAKEGVLFELVLSPYLQRFESDLVDRDGAHGGSGLRWPERHGVAIESCRLSDEEAFSGPVDVRPTQSDQLASS